MRPDLVKDHIIHALETLALFAGRFDLHAIESEINVCVARVVATPAPPRSPGPYPMCRYRNKAHNPCRERGYCADDIACNE